MKLAQLELTNFKGIQHFVFSPDGADCSIFGTNAIGKTTITDGVAWLLTDKSASGKSLNPKTLDVNGDEVHKLEHSAEGNFIIDDGDITLKKIFKEKWVKKRGSTSKEFTGHETDHFVDDVPVSKTAYNKKAEIVANTETFKLLSDIDYLPGKMPWKKRRELILEICGDISDTDVIKNNSALSGLTERLGRHTVEDFMTMTKASMTKINEDIKSIPVRVDEANRSKVETFGNVQDAIKMVEATSKLVEKATADIADLESSEALTKKKNELAQLKLDLQRLELDVDTEVDKAKQGINEKIAEHQAIIDEFAPQVTKLTADAEATKTKKDKAAIDKEALYVEFDSVNATVFEKTSLVCPTCNKPSTEEEANEILGNWNRSKSTKLAEINNRGKKLNEVIADCEKQLVANAENDRVLKAKIKPLSDAIESLTEKLGSTFVTESITLIPSKKSEIETVETEIESLAEAMANGSGEALTTAKANLEQYKQELSEAQTKVLNFETNVKAENRIDELTKEEKTLAQKYEEQEGNLYLCEMFTRAKVEAMERNISGKFKFARFKMFENQINGGLKECCDILMDGIPYGSGLNNAAEINVGLDIINTLSKHYGVTVPIFIDNAESIVDVLESDSQIIKLIVSGDDKSLRVEVD